MRAHRLNVTIPEDHQLSVGLPGDFPPGPAEVIVLTEVPGAGNVVRLLRQPGLGTFGRRLRAPSDRYREAQLVAPDGPPPRDGRPEPWPPQPQPRRSLTMSFSMPSISITVIVVRISFHELTLLHFVWTDSRWRASRDGRWERRRLAGSSSRRDGGDAARPGAGRMPALPAGRCAPFTELVVIGAVGTVGNRPRPAAGGRFSKRLWETGRDPPQAGGFPRRLWEGGGKCGRDRPKAVRAFRGPSTSAGSRGSFHSPMLAATSRRFHTK
jgi:hypothetical protein